MYRFASVFLPALLSATLLAQQPGSVDLSFNASDQGYGLGDGTNNSGHINAMVRQPDGKVIIGGNFGWHNGSLVYPLSRLNADGTRDASFPIGQVTDGIIYALALRPDGRILIGGSFSFVGGVARHRIACLNADGTLDTSFDPGPGPSGQIIHTIAVQTDGRVVIGGVFETFGGVPRANIARLLANGSIDPSFDPGTGAQGGVFAAHITSFGQVLIAGEFTAYNGVPRGRIARLNSNGTLDPNFATGTGANFGTIRAMQVRGDGRIFVGGNFFQFDGADRRYIARLLANGTVDPAFGGAVGIDPSNPLNVYALSEQSDGTLVVGGQFTSVGGTPRPFLAKFSSTGNPVTGYPSGSGPNNIVLCMLLRPDGKLLLGGSFVSFGDRVALGYTLLNADGTQDITFNPGNGCNGGVITRLAVRSDQRIVALGSFVGHNGVTRRGLMRLMADGTLDNSFVPPSLTNATLVSMAVLPDGRMLVAGAFSSLDGHATACVARLNDDGSVDPTFTLSNINNSVGAIAVQADGRILITGSFTTVQGVPRSRVARLLDDGSLDLSFDPGVGPNDLVLDMELMADGRILIAGWFTEFNGITRNRLTRLLADGSQDASFDPGSGANGIVEQVALAADGKILIRGNFSTYNGTARTVLARLDPNGSLDQSFNPGSIQSGTMRTFLPCPDGRIVVAGAQFIGIGGTTLPGIGRLLPDGTIDLGFNSGAGLVGNGTCAVLTNTGQLILAGGFFAYNGTGRNRIARIHNGVTPLVTVRPRVFLDGPLNTATNIMAGQLHAQQLLPSLEPYSAMGYTHVADGGGENALPSAMGPGGNNNAVDWVVVELRDPLEPATILATCSALLQRDGDVVGTNGVSPVSFPLPVGNYHIAIRHRNHLGVMTASPIALSATAAIIDFTNASTPTWGTDARKNNNGTMTLWPGDANFDGQVKYAGPANDRDIVLTTVGGSTPTNTVNTIYTGADVNMDGVVKYAGANNDRDIILQTIGGTVPTAVRVQQLP
jgi:uncharacterized delta-60 repeat protein